METRRLIAGRWLALILATLGVFALIVIKAWVCEDAYITFRVLDNFANGYGLRWNVHERVQAYTHPLWLLLHIPFPPLWPNLFLLNIGLSLTVALATLLVVLATAKRPLMAALCLFLIPFAASKSLVEYSTSGLENPLAHLLFALFGFVLVRLHAHRHFWFWISLTVALALMTRLDAIVLYAPALAYLVFCRFRRVAWGQIILGALPLMAWIAFALLYYGFIFPNTKYAKLNTGFDLVFQFERGLHYLKHLLILDAAGAMVLLASLFFILRPGRAAALAPAALPRLPMFLALGILAHVLYVIAVGGDYMAGRFWSLPVFAGIWTWYMFFPLRPQNDRMFAAACVILTAAALSPLFLQIRQSCSKCIPLRMEAINAISTFGQNRLFKSFDPPEIRRQGHYVYGRKGKEIAQQKSGQVIKATFIGMVGYYGGPGVTIIDKLALTDPLLARLPATRRASNYNGHFYRDVPEGYPHAIKTGSVQFMSKPLGEYYQKLRLITAGELFDRERLRTILRFNLGAYDGLKRRYLLEKEKPGGK